jgi:hypothetical protein
MQPYVIKFVSDLWQVRGFLWFPPPYELTDITERLMGVALYTITLIYIESQSLNSLKTLHHIILY